MRHIYRRVFIGMLCLMPLVGDAATVTVALSGTDANPCTAPKRTIAAGLQCLSAGDTLVVKAGTYPEVIDDTIVAGTPGAPTTIRSDPPGAAVLRPHDAAHSCCVVSISASHIVIDGLDIDMSDLAGNGGIQVRGPASDVLVVNNHVHDLPCSDGCPYGAGGINTKPPLGGGVIFRGNHVHHVGWGIQDNKSHCLYISGNDTLFEGNEIDHCEGFGVHQYASDGPQGDNNIYRGNLIHHTTTRAGILLSSGANVLVEGNCIRDTAGEGIYMGDYGATNRNQQVVNNLILSNAQACVLIGETDHPTVRGNTCFQNGRDVILNERGVQSVIEGNLLGVAPASGACVTSVSLPRLTRLPAPRNLRLRTLP